MINDEDLIFYDIECFRWDSLVILKDINNNIIGHPFWNNRERQKAEIENEKEGYTGPKPVDLPSGFEEIPKYIKGKTLVGYNNYNYDDNILARLLNPAIKQTTVYYTNRTIISGGTIAKSSLYYPTLDTMQQIDISHPSLKQIEGNMGKSIEETEVDFDIDRPLTDEERARTEKYCAYDVENTIEVYKLRKKSYFEVKESLLSMIPDPHKREWLRKSNTTTIAAEILTKGKRTVLWQKHYVPEKFWNEEFRKSSGIAPEVWTMWDESVKSIKATLGKGKSRKQVTPFGVFVFGLGGLHGAPSKPLRRGRCKHKDVKSMYPSAIVALNALDDVETYDNMRKQRVQAKKSDPTLAAALKLILNSVYGQFKAEFSTLYNPLASSTVCIYGQIALFTLCKWLYEAGYEIINANTDGVVYCETASSIEGEDERICKEWEQLFTGYELDTDYYSKWIQKDVNNYIAVEESGKLTVKGGEVNKYQEDKFFANNSIRIVQIAMVEKLLNPGEDLYSILMEYEDRPYLWQFILKAGGTFKGVQDKAGHFQQKVNRIFAAGTSSLRTLESTKLYKAKESADGITLVNFPDVPEEMILWNKAAADLPDFKNNVDLSFYKSLVEKKLKGWPIDVY